MAFGSPGTGRLLRIKALLDAAMNCLCWVISLCLIFPAAKAIEVVKKRPSQLMFDRKVYSNSCGDTTVSITAQLHPWKHHCCPHTCPVSLFLCFQCVFSNLGSEHLSSWGLASLLSWVLDWVEQEKAEFSQAMLPPRNGTKLLSEPSFAAQAQCDQPAWLKPTDKTILAVAS